MWEEREMTEDTYEKKEKKYMEINIVKETWN